MSFRRSASARPEEVSPGPSIPRNALQELNRRARTTRSTPSGILAPTNGPARRAFLQKPLSSPPLGGSQSPPKEVFQPGEDGKLHAIPGWHTTGPTDFKAWSHNIDWPGVADDLGNITKGSLAAIGLGEGAEAALTEQGFRFSPSALKGQIVGHHADPKFLGGLKDQTLAGIIKSVHDHYHAVLRAEFKKAGKFPPIGGVNGSTEKWAELFSKYPELEAEARRILISTTRRFDKQNNTGFSGYIANARRELEKFIETGQKPTSPAPKSRSNSPQSKGGG